ncbi:MAG: DEAD/DEAH box helicase, partial [Thermoproteota archaeon]|nr:DEAD/DEAH box helicase [Thermoproteota archaeon]
IEYIDNVRNFIIKDQSQENKEEKRQNPELGYGIIQSSRLLRDYQTEALNKWMENGKRGCIVLPTGAGKTVIALKAIETTNVSTLIVVPTINLMDQWEQSLRHSMNGKTPIGKLGGGHETINAITVTTYDSAYLKSSYLGNKFEFLIFDEVHHLASEKYSLIAEQFISPYRLGLTATLEREDGRHTILTMLVGNVVFKRDFAELANQNHLAKYKLRKITVSMLPNEIKEYNKIMQEYKNLLKESRIFFPIRLEKLVLLSANSTKLRKALLLRNEATELALNSKAKITELERILRDYQKEKIIIFTIHTRLAYAISNRFLVPVITHKTKNEERNEILEGFKKGKYRIISTTRVLDEGIDVPDANVGVILSGTGSKREFIQRLGRLLRPKQGKENTAELIEIVSMDTSEVFTSNKRKIGISKKN